MDYASTAVILNADSPMLGFLKRKDVERAMKLVHIDMCKSNVEDLPAAQERIAAIVKETAEAKRPAGGQLQQGRHPTAES